VPEEPKESAQEERADGHPEEPSRGRDTRPNTVKSLSQAPEPTRGLPILSTAHSFLSHGLGLEELLLLGLILFLLREGEGEDRGDLDETVILLGLLLLLG
jgi:hypothetical protein